MRNDVHFIEQEYCTPKNNSFVLKHENDFIDIHFVIEKIA